VKREGPQTFLTLDLVVVCILFSYFSKKMFQQHILLLLLVLVPTLYIVEAGTNQCLSSSPAWQKTPAPTVAPTGLPQMKPDICTSGWDVFDGRCYLYSLGPNAPLSGGPTLPGTYTTQTWPNSQTICDYYGANLASVHTLRENCFIYQSITPKPTLQTGTGIKNNNYGNTCCERGVAW
jgi:hypothetical protein